MRKNDLKKCKTDIFELDENNIVNFDEKQFTIYSFFFYIETLFLWIIKIFFPLVGL